jgi:hypothetical protein
MMKVFKTESLNILVTSGPVQAYTGVALTFTAPTIQQKTFLKTWV